ncbi:hypothetical protein BDZ89DRAFT_1126926 [Hymenopellis radicata]|nr:hypothetical protein BDZ89DRAFT_1126926 [Hymenopellis radicata]
MSQVKLTLRQPPNVEFVHGYPGIPSGGTDRPQAAVKGAVEVRVGQTQGVKAKWLRVELRKVETIPGSGGNVFYDYVGPSPVDVWRAHEEWEIVKTGDITFEIRIPESIPPTLSLEGNVGIRYELIASICTKGKRGFLRKRKSNVVSAQTEIIIDKHDLHSTWPWIWTASSSLWSAIIHATLLEIESQYLPLFAQSSRQSSSEGLKYLSVNQGLSAPVPTPRGRKPYPRRRVGNLTENKIPVNVTLMGGMIHKAELQLGIPPNHTTTTLNSARHIDITYVLCVRAIMGTGQPVVMELPVIMSNWPRNVSQEAIRRIGPAPGLSLLAPSNAMHSVEPSRPPPNTFNGRPSPHEIVRPSPNTFSPVSPTQSPLSNGSARPIDDFGVLGSRPTPTTTRSSVDEGGTGRRLTITNAQPMEIPDAHSSRRRPSANATTSNGFIDEKKAYERAKATAERVQSNSPPPSRDGSGGAPVKKWMSAEEEKIKLYNSATARVNKTQGQASDSVSNPETPPPSRGPSAKANGYMSAVDEKAALRRYQEAKNAVEVTQSVGFTNGAHDPPPFEAPSGSSSSGYESAATEKARLKRELAAKSSSGSLSYESAAAEKARLKKELAERERRVSPNNDPPPFDANPSSSSGMNGHANGHRLTRARLRKG